MNQYLIAQEKTLDGNESAAVQKLFLLTLDGAESRSPDALTHPL